MKVVRSCVNFWSFWWVFLINFCSEWSNFLWLAIARSLQKSEVGSNTSITQHPCCNSDFAFALTWYIYVHLNNNLVSDSFVCDM